MILRPQYLDQLTRSKGTDFVKILTGVRRSGKSTLLQMYRTWLLGEGVAPSDILEINFERFEDAPFRDAKVLHEFVGRRASAGEGLFLLIDEVQEVPEWAKVVNSLRVSFKVDIYLTGSNASLFSGDSLTYLAGRYLEIRVFPLSFAEFLAFRGAPEDIQPSRLFETYLRDGSFPAVALTEEPSLIRTINQGLFDSIFARDILMRGQIRDPGSFLKVAKFVFENVGSSVSANNIANVMKSEGSSLKADTVDNYLKLMCDAFILYQCDRFDIRGKGRLRTNGKYYAVDTGIRNQMLGVDASNRGHLLENVVYFELLRRGYQVQTGKNGGLEIDFMVEKDRQRAYVQTCWSIMDEETRKREQAAFRGLPDAFPRYVLSMDDFDLSEQGVRHLRAFDFLLGKTDALR
jgi:predicted AAA+ superfamily ATPase